MSGLRLGKEYYGQDVLVVAPDLIGRVVVRVWPDGRVVRAVITETEAYRGEEDLACHARFGRTRRTEVMYGEGGRVYVYLIYGMYWMWNMVVGGVGDPQAVLVRGLRLEHGVRIEGPGRVGRWLGLDKNWYGENIVTSERMWLEEGKTEQKHQIGPRVGVDYAGKWANKPWRYVAI